MIPHLQNCISWLNSAGIIFFIHSSLWACCSQTNFSVTNFVFPSLSLFLTSLVHQHQSASGGGSGILRQSCHENFPFFIMWFSIHTDFFCGCQSSYRRYLKHKEMIETVIYISDNISKAKKGIFFFNQIVFVIKLTWTYSCLYHVQRLYFRKNIYRSFEGIL